MATETETKEIAEQDAPKSLTTVKNLLEKNKAQFMLALPKHMNVDRLLRLALTACQQNPKLLECHPATLGGAVMMCSIWGVEPIGAGGAWLVPFKNNKKNRMEVQFIVDYRGLAKIARNSGEVQKVEWHEVHKKDKFAYSYGTHPTIEHEPYNGEGDAGEVTHVYAIGFMKNGAYQFVVMTRGEAMKAKAKSKAGDFGPWKTDETEMMLKTAVRRLCKQLPMEPEKQGLVSREEKGDIGVPQDLGTLIDASEVETETEVPAKVYTMPTKDEPQKEQLILESDPNKKWDIMTKVRGVTTEDNGHWVVITVDGKTLHTDASEIADLAATLARSGQYLLANTTLKNKQHWIAEVAEKK